MASSLAYLCSDDVKHQFTVIHFELLRQYIGMEFIGLERDMKFDFDLDSVVDDWVLLMTLIGNDYIPSLAKFDLKSDIISVIYDAYKELLKISNGLYSNKNVNYSQYFKNSSRNWLKLRFFNFDYLTWFWWFLKNTEPITFLKLSSRIHQRIW